MADLEKELTELQELVIQELRKRIESGKASPSDISNAIKILKDNSITVMPQKGSPLEALKDDLELFQTDKVVDISKYQAQ